MITRRSALTGLAVAVADAAGLDRFALLGIVQGCAFSIRYAVEHPDRVTCLLLLGGYLRGRLKRPHPEQKKLYEALTLTIRDGWGSSNPVFRHFFTSNFIPDAPPDIAERFDELQRIATSPENAVRLWQMNAEVDVTDAARQVRVPTLVLHCRGDRVAPLDEGRLMARLIPGADFAELPGQTEALTLTIRDGWGSSNPVFRHFFTSNFIPDAPPDIAERFDELQRIATSPENAVRLWQMNAEVDGHRRGEAGARAHARAALPGRPRRAAGRGPPDGAAHPGRRLRRAAGQQPRGSRRHPSLRPVLRGRHRLPDATQPLATGGCLAG